MLELYPHIKEIVLLCVPSDTDTKAVNGILATPLCSSCLSCLRQKILEKGNLKTILHRIYGKYMVHRPFIRKGLTIYYIGFVYETRDIAGLRSFWLFVEYRQWICFAM